MSGEAGGARARLTPGLDSVLVLCAVLGACDTSRPPSFGALEVGGLLPGYGARSYLSGRELGPTTPPGGTIYVHVIDERLPITCLDEECGPEAKRVTDRGGHLIGASDGKLAKGFGVDAGSKPERRLVVVSDGAGLITSIVLDRGLAELDSISLEPTAP